jgi:hypothetical protein
MRNCLACQEECFVNNPFDVKENDGHALDFALHLSRLFQSRCLFSPNACLIIARVSVSLILTFLQNFMLFLCRINLEIASGQTHDSKESDVDKVSASTHLCDISCTDSQDMLALSPTVASRYCNCYTDGSTSPGNYGYIGL